ncbi:MAG: hypothetical protein ACSHXL_04215 [Bacteroidota bacterium]
MEQTKLSSRSKHLLIVVLLTITSFIFEIKAQSFDSLNHLEGHNINTYYSNGSEEQAETMATRCDSVMSFYKTIIRFQPTVTLLVLSPLDWWKYTNFPVYGMPHYDDAQTLIVASEDNDFWKSFIPDLKQLPAELAQEITNTYSNQNGALTMRSFFDLLAIHELGHAFHIQGKLKMQRKWMGELFANIFLHTYIAEKEPELLAALTVFPQMVVASTNIKELKFITLNELEDNYNILGQQYPQNYGWYQCKWHIASRKIYDSGGNSAIQNLWFTLQSQHESLDDEKFAKLLQQKAHQSIADVQLKWDE